MTSRPVAVAVAASALLWNNVVAPALTSSPRSRAAANAVVAVTTTAVARQRGVKELGLNFGGFRLGAAAATVPLSAYALVGAVPALRARFVAPPEDAPAEWVLFRIPFGTVVTEELIFRSVLHSLSLSAFGPRWSLAFDSVVFGLWHRRMGPGTVAVTGLSTLVFDGLRRRSGSVVAPAMFHYALNGGGALLRIRGHRGAQ